MAIFKVSKEKIKLSVHYNADSLEIANAGGRQYVVKLGSYSDGETVIQIPEKAILPEAVADEFRTYLTGEKKNRVKTVTMRGELSEGIMLDMASAIRLFGDNIRFAEYGVDLSEQLGIEMHTPSIPTSMSGNVEVSKVKYRYNHDVEQYAINKGQYGPDDIVRVTEKLHGSQIVIHVEQGVVSITSKGLNKSGLCLKEDHNNFYWRTWSYVAKFIKPLLDETKNYCLIGEALPCQKGFTYGLVGGKQKVLFFKAIEGGTNYCLDIIPTEFQVPLLFSGKYSDVESELRTMADTKYSSLDSKTIREGIVLSGKGKSSLKILSKHYKQTGEEFN